MRQVRQNSSRWWGCWWSALFMLLAVMFSGCSRPVPPDSEVVAKIGSREIRKAEFQAWMQRRATGNDPKEKVALLNEMLDHLALVEQAKMLGLDRDPELLRSWDNILVAKLREIQFEPLLTNTEPTEAQIRTHYQSNRVEFTEPGMRRGAMLYAELPGKGSSDDRLRIRQRLTEARTKALTQSTNVVEVRGFGPLAIEYSEDQSTRYRGGDFGWVRAGRSDARFDRQVIDHLFALARTGDVSDVLETPRGFYLVKLLDIRPEREKTLAEVQEKIRHQLYIENSSRAESQWKKSARTALSTEIHEEVLAGVSLPQSSNLATNPPTLP